jgi:hypothetical protein
VFAGGVRICGTWNFAALGGEYARADVAESLGRPADGSAARASWKQQQLRLDPTKLVSIEPRGEQLVAKIPQGHWKVTTFVAGLRKDSITAPFVVDAR